MGLTHHVPDGALLDFAGKLDATKQWHRVAAWGLLVVFGLPVVFAVLRVLTAFSR
jgi:thiosulfate reductase cytochrome b subunit